MCIPQLLVGLLLLALSHYLGHTHLHLIREGLRAPGRIIGYKQQNFRSSSSESFSTTGYMPIVEFQANDRSIHFQDWLGTSIAGSKNVPVIVLYDPAIDRPVWNWLPWAPIFALGLFLVLAAINGFFRSQRPAEK